MAGKRTTVSTGIYRRVTVTRPLDNRENFDQAITAIKSSQAALLDPQTILANVKASLDALWPRPTQDHREFTKAQRKLAREYLGPKASIEQINELFDDVLTATDALESIRHYLTKRDAKAAVACAIRLGQYLERLGVRSFEPMVRDGKVIHRARSAGAKETNKKRRQSQVPAAQLKKEYAEIKQAESHLSAKAIYERLGNRHGKTGRTIRNWLGQ